MYDFETNKVVESLDTVPEQYRGVYAEATEGENAGKYVVAQPLLGFVSDYVSLTKNLAGLRNEKKSVTDENAKRRLEAKAIHDLLTGLGIEIGEEGINPALETYVKDLQEKVKGGQSLKVDMEKLQKQYEAKLKDGLTAKDEEINGMMGSLRKHMVTSAAHAALARHKGSAELLLPHIESRAEVVKDDDGNFVVRIKDSEGNYLVNGAGTFAGVEDLVVDMKTKDAFSRAFESEAPSGTGSVPGAMRRPAAQNQKRELSSAEKIRVGLQKNQHQQGYGGARR